LIDAAFFFARTDELPRARQSKVQELRTRAWARNPSCASMLTLSCLLDSNQQAVYWLRPPSANSGGALLTSADRRRQQSSDLVVRSFNDGWRRLGAVATLAITLYTRRPTTIIST